MAKLPLTVTNVTRRKGDLWAVTVAFADGTTANYIIPVTMATVEGVTISALAMGVLSDLDVAEPTHPHHVHYRRWPRV